MANYEKESTTLTKIIIGKDKLNVLLGRQKCMFYKATIGYNDKKTRKPFTLEPKSPTNLKGPKKKTLSNLFLYVCLKAESDKGYKVVFNVDCCMICDNVSHEVKFIGNRIENIYMLSLENVSSNETNCLISKDNDSFDYLSSSLRRMDFVTDVQKANKSRIEKSTTKKVQPSQVQHRKIQGESISSRLNHTTKWPNKAAA
ncbi:hypothetical protein CR513_17713, partial [Mucuna pruriens]